MPYRIHDEETRPYGRAPRIACSDSRISQVPLEPVDAQNAKLLNCLQIVYHNPAELWRSLRQTALADDFASFVPFS